MLERFLVPMSSCRLRAKQQPYNLKIFRSRAKAALYSCVQTTQAMLQQEICHVAHRTSSRLQEEQILNAMR